MANENLSFHKKWIESFNEALKKVNFFRVSAQVPPGGILLGAVITKNMDGDDRPALKVRWHCTTSGLRHSYFDMENGEYLGEFQ